MLLNGHMYIYIFNRPFSDLMNPRLPWLWENLDRWNCQDLDLPIS
jgi:hypothetical protein